MNLPSLPQLRKYLDRLRVVLSIAVGIATWLVANASLLHLPSGIVGVIVGVIAFVSHYILRTKTVPDPAKAQPVPTVAKQHVTGQR